MIIELGTAANELFYVICHFLEGQTHRIRGFRVNLLKMSKFVHIVLCIGLNTLGILKELSLSLFAQLPQFITQQNGIL